MKTIKKAVMVRFENYYSRIERQLVIGTIDRGKAIRSVKDFQCNRKVEVKECIILKDVNPCEIDFDIDYAINL